jgi:hypothetical protein
MYASARKLPEKKNCPSISSFAPIYREAEAMAIFSRIT